MTSIQFIVASGVALFGALLVGACGCFQTSRVEGKPRNVIVVIVDDLGLENVDVYDSEGVSGPTPQLDSLAAAGIRFTNFWAHPVCSPFRASALTGLYSQGHGLGHFVNTALPLHPTRSTGLNPNVNNLARILTKAGFRTEAYGKWHLAGRERSDMAAHANDIGFQHAAMSISNLEFGINGFGSGTYTSWEKCTNGTCAEETTYATTDTTDDAITGLAGTEPFFLWVAYQAPHKPIHVPPAGLWADDETCTSPAATERGCYKAMIEALDTELGRFIDSVDLNDTTVIIASDNGTPADAGIVESPRTRLNVKRSVHKWGINTPFIVLGDAVPAGRVGDVETAFVNATDIYKTVLDLATVDVPANDRSTAISFVPVLLDDSAVIRDLLFVERFDPNNGPPDASIAWMRAIQCTAAHASCDVSYKLVQDLFADTESFYDKNADETEASALNTGSLTANQQTAYDALSALIQTEGTKGDVPESADLLGK